MQLYNVPTAHNTVILFSRR